MTYRIVIGKLHKKLLSTEGSVETAAKLLRKYIDEYERKVKNGNLGKGFQKTPLFFVKQRSIFKHGDIYDLDIPDVVFGLFCAMWNSGKEILDAKEPISNANYINAYIHACNSMLLSEYINLLTKGSQP